MGFAGERQHLFEARDARANVDVDWCLRSCGDTEYGQQLISRCRRCIRESSADVDGAFTETDLNALRDLANLRGCRGAIGAVAHRHHGPGIVHHRHADLDVTDADAVVDPVAGAALAVPGGDIGRSELEL